MKKSKDKRILAIFTAVIMALLSMSGVFGGVVTAVDNNEPQITSYLQPTGNVDMSIGTYWWEVMGYNTRGSIFLKTRVAFGSYSSTPLNGVAYCLNSNLAPGGDGYYYNPITLSSMYSSKGADLDAVAKSRLMKIIIQREAVETAAAEITGQEVNRWFVQHIIWGIVNNGDYHDDGGRMSSGITDDIYNSVVEYIDNNISDYYTAGWDAWVFVTTSGGQDLIYSEQLIEGETLPDPLPYGKTHEISVTKTDMDGNSLSGAEFTLCDVEEKPVITEVTEYGLTAKLREGSTYSIEETQSPEGFKPLEEKFTFTVTESGIGLETTSDMFIVDGYNITVRNAPIEYNATIIKVDEETGENIEGAELRILNGDEVITKIDGVGDTVTDLSPDLVYTIVEANAPDGYIKGDDISFSFALDGTLTTNADTDEDGSILVKNRKTYLSVTKKDSASETILSGAALEIRSAGEVIEQWTSSDEVHIIRGLKIGTKYVLHEEKAPKGYTVAEDIPFSINENGDVICDAQAINDNNIVISDKQTEVSFVKVDADSGESVIGAHIQIMDGENVVDEWDTTAEKHVITGLEMSITYTVHESAAPAGYIMAKDSYFTIDAYGNISTTADIDENGTILIKNSKTKVSISKVDSANKALSGAELAVYDVEEVIDSWTSDGTVHTIEGLLTDKEYAIREAKSPNGYTKSADITFSIASDGTLTSSAPIGDDGVIRIINNKIVIIPEKPEPVLVSPSIPSYTYTPVTDTPVSPKPVVTEQEEDVTAGAGIDGDGIEL